MAQQRDLGSHSWQKAQPGWRPWGRTELGFGRRFRKIHVAVMVPPTTACSASFCSDSKIPSPYSSAQDPTWSRVPLELRSHFLPLPLLLSHQPHLLFKNGKHSSFSGHLHFFSLLPMTPHTRCLYSSFLHSVWVCAEYYQRGLLWLLFL